MSETRNKTTESQDWKEFSGLFIGLRGIEPKWSAYEHRECFFWFVKGAVASIPSTQPPASEKP